jgi:transcriptional regulator NrdR family protein
MLKCPYQFCKSKDITVLDYNEIYRDGQLVCITYECMCYECGGKFTHSKNLEA